MVGGRTVEVDLALKQDDARALAIGKLTAASHGKDNRNLYLVRQMLSRRLCCSRDRLRLVRRGVRFA